MVASNFSVITFVDTYSCVPYHEYWNNFLTSFCVDYSKEYNPHEKTVTIGANVSISDNYCIFSSLTTDIADKGQLIK